MNAVRRNLKLPLSLFIPLLWAGWVGQVTAGLPEEFSSPVIRVYIDSAYSSSTPGWGVTHFQTLEDAAPVVPGSSVRIADGMALTISGSLILNGCAVECVSSNGSYTLSIESGAEFQLFQSAVSGCSSMTISGIHAEIQNCLFSGTPVQIASSAVGVRFLHNVLVDGATLTDQGANTVTEADGWANPDSLSKVWNRVSLEWLSAGLGAGRTLDGDGLFIQPGDSAGLQIMLSNLSLPVAACEILMGYDAGLLTNTTLTLTDPWGFNLAEIRSNGTLNAAIGLGRSAPLEGTDEDGPVAELVFQTLENEGRSVVFFRAPDGLWENRLASDTNGSSGVYLSSFSVNSKTVTIDGTAPQLQPLQVEQDGTNLLEAGERASTGTVTVMLDAADGLAGLAGASLSVSPMLNISSPAESVEGGTNHFTWGVEITDQTASGIYTLEAVAVDRSGNASTNLAEFAVGRPPLSLTVAMQGAVLSAYTFDVTIQALDASGTELTSWIVPSDFLSAQISFELTGLPDSTAFLTADTAVSLRRKVPVDFVDGVWVLEDFDGDHALVGGDLNGDNIVNSFDYVVFRHHFQSLASEADINRDGVVNSFDFVIMRQNWQQAGE